MAAYVEGPRHYRITYESQGAKVLVTTYIMMCNTVLSVLGRAGIKFATARRWSWDDTAISLAAVFALGHSGSMAASYEYGMGLRMNSARTRAGSRGGRAFCAPTHSFGAHHVLKKTDVELTSSSVCSSHNLFFLSALDTHRFQFSWVHSPVPLSPIPTSH